MIAPNCKSLILKKKSPQHSRKIFHVCYLFFGSLLEPRKCYVRGYLLSPAKAQRIYIPKYLSLLMEYYEAIISYFKYI